MGRQGWYGGVNRGGPRGWMRLLLPLIVGIGLGAWLFGGPRFGARSDDYRYQSRQSQPQVEQQQATTSERSAESVQSTDQYAFGRENAYGPRGGRHHGGFGFGGFGFGGFGLGRLLLPLLLIGGGVWLLNRRRGPGAPGGPPQGGQPVGPVTPSDPPTTGETTRL